MPPKTQAELELERKYELLRQKKVQEGTFCVKAF